MIAGLILAGGEGRRMGGGKALTLLAGAPLIAHVARALGDVSVLAVAGDLEAAKAIDAEFVPDPPDVGRGPLAGVLAGLEWCANLGADWLVTAPCDAPFLPLDLPARLRAAAGEGAIACVESEAGLEPLMAIWRAELVRELRAEMIGGRHPPVHALLSTIGTARLSLTTEEVMNVNTPEELARAEALLAQR